MAKQKIQAAILKTISEVPSLIKDTRNAHGKYNFVSIDNYYEDVAKIATKNGLSWQPKELYSEVLSIPNSQGNLSVYIKFTYSFTLFTADEEWPEYFSCSIIHPLIGAQTSGSALSYAEKLLMRSSFKVITGEADADSSDMGMAPTTTNAADPFAATPQPPKVVKETPAPVVDKLSEDEANIFLAMTKEFMPLAKTKAELREFWHKNHATIERLKASSQDQYKALTAEYKSFNANLPN